MPADWGTGHDERICVTASVPIDLLAVMDQVVAAGYFRNRSEMVRELIDGFLDEFETAFNTVERVLFGVEIDGDESKDGSVSGTPS
jgi:Arc/MetJ-type ribon-helix-helix transcriptional regulator